MGLELLLKKIATFQKKYALLIFTISMLLTLFFALGALKLKMETDIDKEMPQHLPVFVLKNKVNDAFGGQDSIILIFSIDDSSTYRNKIKDIRDPRVINYIKELQSELEKESSIEGVTSIATYLKNIEIKDINQVKYLIDVMPQTKEFFSQDYKDTIMIIRADVGGNDEKLKSLYNVVNMHINTNTKPAGIKITKTGVPPMRIKLFSLLSHDAIYTITLAAIIILILLFIMERSIIKGFLIFTPLLISLIWTLGTLGWLGIKLSIATVGLGAMLLGLGVEYGVFMLSRYEEERKKGLSQEEALKISVPSVGGAILGSGTTTIVGFLALTLSIIPMVQHLGISMALGIFYALFSAIIISPVIFILAERLMKKEG